MTVHKEERGEDKLDAQKNAEKLLAHTVHIMANVKVFDPAYAYLHRQIADCAVEIGADIWEANGIKVGSSARRYLKRLELQEDAIRKTGRMLFLMGAAKRLDKKLRTMKYLYWVNLARETRSLAIAWRDSDARRYGHLIRDAGCNAQRMDALGEPRQREQRGDRQHVGQLQQQQRDQRESRGAGSCRETRRGGRT